MYGCTKCRREFEFDHNICPICRSGHLIPAAPRNRSAPPPAFGPPPTTNTNYKKRRAEEKKKKTDDLLAAAKQEVRRLEKGIDKVLYDLANEDITKSEVIAAIHKNLFDLYNGKEI